MNIKEKIKRSALYRFRGFFVRHYPSLIVENEWPSFARHEIDWDNPRDLNEKIQYLQCKTDTRLWSRLADKIAVRDYVREKGLDSTLPKLYGVWKNADDIDFDALPEKFMLKCNHDSGSYIKVDKSKPVDERKIKDYLNACLKRSFGISTCEPHYLRIPRRILAEEFLSSKQDEKISSSLIDYKVWCFNGKPYCILVTANRTKEGKDMSVYDIDWNSHPEWLNYTDEYRHGETLPKPKLLNTMLQYAALLAKGLPEVRVDLYIVEGKIYFGEMTFTGDCGRMRQYTEDFLIEMGRQVDVSED